MLAISRRYLLAPSKRAQKTRLHFYYDYKLGAMHMEARQPKMCNLAPKRFPIGS